MDNGFVLLCIVVGVFKILISIVCAIGQCRKPNANTRPNICIDENDGWAWFFQQQQQQYIYDEQNRLFDEQCQRDMQEQFNQFNHFNQSWADFSCGFDNFGSGGFGF